MSTKFVPVFVGPHKELMIPKATDFGYEDTHEAAVEAGAEILELFENTTLTPHSILTGEVAFLSSLSIGEVVYEEFEFLIMGRT